ncbi:UbiA family prenyltransferase [Pelagicoccus enzymogenes]|uniref:UbiA family prenyltransferase n=1 Tax=Pelagicoccus enzymogenes TaxID=2773457 RepID=UPI00280D780B|nr:UbiA family prenyltransferase [Pelagicoccus enzymogenes]MDQ8200865.1 UbiA family prenyltransferase [Pelagicoccus enzymogenes]
MENRWWTYQRERFPLFKHGILILAFSAAALTYSRLLRGELTFFDLQTYTVAFATALTYFMQLRIADEFKDFEEDSRYRPYRAVPRGLIKLRELGWVFVGCSLIQVSLAYWLYPKLIVLLLVTWLYLAGMSHEFFVRDWLKARPITYLWTHMLIMPLVDLYITSCDWMVSGMTSPPNGIVWFLVVSFFNGVLLEFGRKMRAPEDEETGVETYTFLWGIKRATFAWLFALSLNFFAALMAALNSGNFVFTSLLLAIPFLAGVRIGLSFRGQPDLKRASLVENFSGLWTLAMYLALGPIALAYHIWIK